MSKTFPESTEPTTRTYIVVFTCKLSLKKILLSNLDRLIRLINEHRADRLGYYTIFNPSDKLILPPSFKFGTMHQEIIIFYRIWNLHRFKTISPLIINC